MCALHIECPGETNADDTHNVNPSSTVMFCNSLGLRGKMITTKVAQNQSEIDAKHMPYAMHIHTCYP